MLEDEPLYWIEELDPDEDGADVQLGFSDLAAHPYHALVEATADMLATVPGVLAAWHEDREVVLVRAPGVAPELLADAVDRFWLDALTRTPPDPSYGWEPDPSRPRQTWTGRPPGRGRRRPSRPRDRRCGRPSACLRREAGCGRTSSAVRSRPSAGSSMP